MKGSNNRIRVYIYPPYKGKIQKTGNKYTQLLWNSFEESSDFEVVNHQVTNKPFYDFFFNINADIFIFSWIESYAVTPMRMGKFIYVLSFILILRLLNKKVVWIMHNKHPHSKATKTTDWAMRTLAKVSTHVITHAAEGVTHFECHLKGKRGKCVFIPHPVYTDEFFESYPLKWDYIIWGSISPRKGIVEFLNYVKGEKYFTDKKILICGRCGDKHYAQQIEENCSENIEFINEFISDEQLKEYIGASASILFTYQESSILSSGALVYSLNFCKPIIGPNVGSFSDMKGIVKCYDSFADIQNICIEPNLQSVKSYIQNNTWKQFPQKVKAIVQS